jgi:hypothetical protein
MIIRIWEDMARKSSSNWSAAQHRFLRVLLGDSWTDSLPTSWQAILDAELVELQPGPTLIELPFDKLMHCATAYSPTSALEKAFCMLAGACLNRRFFITQRGYSGLAQWRVAKGHRVCILEGSAVPCILAEDSRSSRRLKKLTGLACDPRRSYWRYLGQAVVEGWMHRTREDIDGAIAAGEIHLRDWWLT